MEGRIHLGLGFLRDKSPLQLGDTGLGGRTRKLAGSSHFETQAWSRENKLQVGKAFGSQSLP